MVLFPELGSQGTYVHPLGVTGRQYVQMLCALHTCTLFVAMV